MARRDDINSVIGEGSSFTGTMKVAGSLQIDGRFEGNVNTEGHLVIGAEGKVKTCINAEEVTIAGTLIGDINSKGDVLLLETGRILGNIEAPKIHMTDGVVVQGSLNITGGQKREASKVVEESFNGLSKLKGEKPHQDVEDK